MNRWLVTGSRSSRASLSLLLLTLPLVISLAVGGCQKDETVGLADDAGNTGAGGFDGGLTGIGIGTGGVMDAGDPDALSDAPATDAGEADLPVNDVAASDAADAADSVADVGVEAAADIADAAPPPVDTSVDVPAPPPAYAGTPWNNVPQQIPGMIRLDYYDQGGEGVAYHDFDPTNNGADMARGGDPKQPELTFRTTEGVDLRSTRAMDKYTDGTPVEPGHLYVGWTRPGEWLNYTVNVTGAGHYTVGVLAATQNAGPAITLTLEDGTTTGMRPIPWTRSYTTWAVTNNVAGLDLSAGKHVLTLRLETAEMNLGYLTFTRAP